MPTIRVKKGRTPFTRIENSLLQDSRLSWKARGLLAYMLSKPDDFIFHMDELTRHTTDGIDSIRAGIKELQVLGYIKRHPIKEKGKIVTWEMIIFEKPESGFPDVEKPLVENPMLITNDLITNDLNKKDIYIDLQNIGDSFIQSYIEAFKRKMKKKHMRVTEEQLSFIQAQIEQLRSYDIDEHEWTSAVKEHFSELPKSNNGNIIAFLHASHRFFEIN